MPFREKSAWISLVSLIVTFGLFFGAMARGVIATGGHDTFVAFSACVAAFVALQIVLRIIASMTTPQDDKGPQDEREQLISLKATRNANIALVLGALAVPGSQHLPVHTHNLGYLIMLALVVAEIVRAVSRIAYFRRGH